MLLWVLCVKLSWLLLPLGTLAHPSVRDTLGRRSISGPLEIRDDLDSWADVNQFDRSQTETLPAKYYRSAPLLINPDGLPLLASAPMANDSMLNPIWFWYQGAGNLTKPTGLGRDVPIDFEYPPFTEKKLLVIRGHYDTDTTDCEVDVDVLGFPLGDFKGNLDDGMRIDVNIMVAKGDLILYEIRGKPKDQIWIQVDLQLPFHQQFHKKLHMFDVPHRDVRQRANSQTATA
ncbi:MAG: hypothetical protein LQ350_000079 [Teloschistes chrysophthalmus]|nr:MAG: hypothetical protein LQ350_000079 [Niorma chrysophthalma]